MDDGSIIYMLPALEAVQREVSSYEFSGCETDLLFYIYIGCQFELSWRNKKIVTYATNHELIQSLIRVVLPSQKCPLN